MACYEVTNCTLITLAFHRVIHYKTTRRHGGQTVEKGHSFGAEFKSRGLVLPVDEPQGLKECTAEKLKFFITLTELRLQ